MVPEENEFFQGVKIMAHKDICIPFTITDKDGTEHHFEAVGFLNEGEEHITLEEALRRSGTRVVTNDEDWERIYGDAARLSKVFQKYYYLFTKRLNPGYPGFSCLYRDGGEMVEDWDNRAFECRCKTLVLRRSANSRSV